MGSDPLTWIGGGKKVTAKKAAKKEKSAPTERQPVQPELTKGFVVHMPDLATYGTQN